MPRNPAKASLKHVFHPHDIARAEALAGTPLAKFPQRLAAYAIDLFLVVITWAPVEVGREYLILKARHEPIAIRVQFDFHELSNIVWLVLYFGLVVWKTNGYTLGKRLLGIRIVSLTHSRITLWQSVERALGYGASILEAGSGFFQYFTAHNHCCVHDRIAETIVIHERALKRMSAEQRAAAHAG